MSIKKLIASAFGLGLSPIAPGSFGALLGVLIHVILYYTFDTVTMVAGLTLFLVLTTYLNWLLTPWAVQYWKSEDPKNFVLDEIAGYLVVPILYHSSGLFHTVAYGFVLFRILDIIKIPPAKQIDKNMKNSWGIVLDDIVSGLYAVGLLYLLHWINIRYIGSDILP